MFVRWLYIAGAVICLIDKTYLLKIVCVGSVDLGHDLLRCNNSATRWCEGYSRCQVSTGFRNGA